MTAKVNERGSMGWVPPQGEHPLSLTVFGSALKYATPSRTYHPPLGLYLELPWWRWWEERLVLPWVPASRCHSHGTFIIQASASATPM
jgi:hypothetical protein